MSNIATPRRTEFDTPSIARAIAGRPGGIVIATIILSVLIISMRPLGLGYDLNGPAPTGGDILNQVGFSAIGIVSILSILTLADRNVIAGLFDLPLMIMFGIVFLSLLTGLGPDAGMRVFLFTVFALLGIAAVLVVPRDAEALATVFAVAGLIVLALSYFGVLALPQRAIHQAYEQENIHAGLWRGAFAHKNIAGPVMATITFAGLMLWRMGRVRLGLLMIALAGFFLFNTGSKTTAGIVPMAAAIVLLPALAGQRWLSSTMALLTLAVFLTFTVGMVLSEDIRDIVYYFSHGTTYTGRTSLWTFMVARIAEEPWTGYGLENFWKTASLKDFERTWYLDWDVRTSVHGHNGYLDVALAMGLPAFFYFVFVMIVRPAIDYARPPLKTGNIIFSDFFMMVFVFTTLNACLESFFFRRADPVWLFFFMSVLGLRLCARFAVARTPARI
jgi:O-antigen ligase